MTTESDRILELVTTTLDAGKAEEINPINLMGRSSLADYMVVASGTSARHIHALAQQVLDALAQAGQGSSCKIEGANGDEWLAIDLHEVIVHLFTPDRRAFYHLDDMWQIEALSTRDDGAKVVSR